MSKLIRKRSSESSSLGVRELRAHLPKYLKWVSNGNMITVMKGDHPIARLVPPLSVKQDAWTDLEEIGLLSAASASKRVLPEPVEAPKGVLLSAAVEESREDRF